MATKDFVFYKQHDAMDCGPACLRMVAAHHGKEYSLEYLREYSHITKDGVNLSGISHAAENINLSTLAVKVKIEKLVTKAPFPCILHWNQNHFIVLYKVKKNNYYIADPSAGKFKLGEEAFMKSWMGTSNQGIALLLEPNYEFHKSPGKEQDKKEKKGFRFLLGYLRSYKPYLLQLLLSMLVGTLLSLVLPFLTQSLVDKGINKQNIGFVKLILLSQLVIFAGSLAIEMIRNWLMLHMNSRINIAIISDFLMKLMKLPINFFDTRHIGDIKQRLGDHGRIQSFLTGTALNTLFSMLNMIVFITVIAVYSVKILIISLFFSALAFSWIILFLRRRKQLDYIRFQRNSNNENILYELITGMQEIKLNNCETEKRWGWERIQAKLFSLNIQSLALGQTQKIGYSFFTQLKNIIIAYLSAREVINGNMTLGMMMSISYIIGQLDTPIQSLLVFVQSAQDAKISLDRLSEIHNKENEETPTQIRNLNTIEKEYDKDNSRRQEDDGLITFSQVSFQYQGPGSPMILNNIDLTIPKGKVTAIVGMSGSGKTTLLKLLLKFYKPAGGKILIGQHDLADISPAYWRRHCGTVMDGYIFNDTIAGNITLTEDDVDWERLKRAIRLANIEDFIEELPMKLHTNIGNTGTGISSGQRQRILIARAIYKDPEYLFFDEATNMLDSNNESTIMENLERFFQGKTVVVIAHRLSTVKNADQIIVMEKGCIAEIGTHQSLIAKEGKYFTLVKKQLELQSV